MPPKAKVTQQQQQTAQQTALSPYVKARGRRGSGSEDSDSDTGNSRRRKRRQGGRNAVPKSPRAAVVTSRVCEKRGSKRWNVVLAERKERNRARKQQASLRKNGRGDICSDRKACSNKAAIAAAKAAHYALEQKQLAKTKRATRLDCRNFEAFRRSFFERHEADIRAISDLDEIRWAPVNSAVQQRFLKRAAKASNKVQLAFHGTALANMQDILKTGLRVPGAASGVRVANGSAFGVGIYTSQHAMTSLCYRRQTSTMFVCAVLEVGGVSRHGSTLVVFQEDLVVPLFLVDTSPAKLSARGLPWVPTPCGCRQCAHQVRRVDEKHGRNKRAARRHVRGGRGKLAALCDDNDAHG